MGRNLLKLTAMLLLIAVSVALSGYYVIQHRPLNLGLDLKGGVHVVLQADETEKQVTAREMDQVLAVLDQRINKLGVTEPLVQKAGTNRIIIELAGISDPEEAVELIGRTAMLSFRTEDGQEIISGKDVKEATEALDPASGRAVILLSLKPEGTEKFAKATSENVGRTIGIYLDEEQLQNPVVNEPINDGQAQITGYADLQEAKRYADLINSGALPVKMDMIEKRTVGPLLGIDSLNKSYQAAWIGIGLIFLFMLLYYRLPGLVAVVSLLLYGAIVLAVLALLKATLTLPGIAGLIISVGIAVDANIIIYERLKEELRAGKTLRAAIDAGFARALWTIIDANVTTLLAVGVLLFGFGPIKGFAVTLGLGILASMFTAITFTRYLLRLIAGTNLFNNKKFYGVKGGKPSGI